MNFKKAFFCGLAFYLAKDVYEFITEVGCKVIYDRHGDKIQAWREKYYDKVHKKDANDNSIIGFRA